MDTGTTIAAEIASVASLPTLQAKLMVKSEAEPIFSTTSSTNESVYSKEIVVRGTGTISVTVTVNVQAEALRQKNLVANRGPVVSETTTGHEG